MSIQLKANTQAGSSQTQNVTPQEIVNVLFGVGIPVANKLGGNETITIVQNGTLTTLTLSLLDVSFDTDLSSPGPIGSADPSSGAFTTLVATSLDGTPIGSKSQSSGSFTDLNVNDKVSGAGFDAYMASPPAIGSDKPAPGNFTDVHISGEIAGPGIEAIFSAPHAIGYNTPESGAFTKLSATETVYGKGFDAYMASPPPIGSEEASTGTFTTLTASKLVGNGFTDFMASPLAIGDVKPNSGAFTTLVVESGISGDGVEELFASPFPIGTLDADEGHFTVLTATETVSGKGFDDYLATPPGVGATKPNSGNFTSLSASGAISGEGFVARLATPGPIGNTKASSGAFTTLRGTSLDYAPIGSVEPETGAFTSLSAKAAIKFTGTIEAFPLDNGLTITPAGKLATTQKTASFSWNGTNPNNSIVLIAVGPMTITSISVRIEILEGDVGTIMPVVAASNTPVADGTAMLPAAIDANANPAIVQNNTVSIVMKAGDCIGVKTSGSFTKSSGNITFAWNG